MKDASTVIVSIVLFASASPIETEDAIIEISKLGGLLKLSPLLSNARLSLVVIDRANRTKPVSVDKDVQWLSYSGSVSLRELKIDLYSRLNHAGSNIIVELKANRSYDFASVAEILTVLYEEHEVVVGSRRLTTSSGLERFCEALLGRYFWFRFGFSVSDWGSELLGFRVTALQKVRYHDIQADGIGFLAEFLARCICSGERCAEVRAEYDRRRDERPYRNLRHAWSQALGVRSVV